MTNRRSVLLALAAAAAGIVIGAALAVLLLAPARARGDAAAKAAKRQAGASRQQLLDTRLAWIVQMDTVYSAGSAEPTRPVTNGVYFATLTPDPASTTHYFADWVGIRPAPLAGDVGNSPVMNRSPFRQRLELTGTVFVLPDKNAQQPYLYGPVAVDSLQFHRDLGSNSATGASLRQATWYVTVREGLCDGIVQR